MDMMAPQIDIPVQPHETAVTAALRVLAHIGGWCVTHTTDGQHATTSLHYVGRAVDLADFSGPGWDSPQLLSINKAVLQLVPLQFISELIYAGPGGVCVKNGKVVNGAAVYGAAVMAEHHNHVHLGVVPTFTYKETAVADTTAPPPDYTVNAAPVSISITPSGHGYVILCADGGVFAFGDAEYHGRVHV